MYRLTVVLYFVGRFLYNKSSAVLLNVYFPVLGLNIFCSSQDMKKIGQSEKLCLFLSMYLPVLVICVSIDSDVQCEGLLLQGYRKLLRKLVFEKAGYQLESSKKEAIVKEAEEKDKEQEKVSKGEFDTLSQCTEVSL